MSLLRDQAARRRLELNPITTTTPLGLAVAQPPPQLHHTPISAVSASSLSAQFGHHAVPYTPTPLSGVREYNPQQWVQSPNVLSDHGQVLLNGARPRDPEVVVPAPPPYSPPRQQPASYNNDYSNTSSPATRISPVQHSYRSSPEPSSQPVFHSPPVHQRQWPHNAPERPQSLYTASPSVRRPATDVPVPHLSQETIRMHTSQQPRPQTMAFGPGSSQQNEYQVDEVDSRPPAARRAVSAGAITPSTSARPRGSSTSNWAPGMPLPPPPPGPPPPQSRSQSMNRTDHMTSPPTRRPAPIQMGSSLGPVPPTPADWVDEDLVRRDKSPQRGLYIDTSSVSSSTVAPDSHSGSSSSGLTRHHAIKGEPKSIRERRSESKSGKRLGAEEPSNNPWAEAITPSDSGVPPLTILGRRPTAAKPSAGSYSSEAPRTGETSSHTTPVQGTTPGLRSRGSTPKPPAPTPPFSPGPSSRSSYADGSPMIPPKALPTPPPQKLALGSPAHSLHPHSETISHELPTVIPLLLSRPGSRQSMSDHLPVSPAGLFARSAIERHHAFIQRETAASSDDERVRLFAEYVVTESRMRRERYSAAIEAMGPNIAELTRDLFQPYSRSRRESTVSRTSGWTPESSAAPGSRSHRSSIIASTQLDIPQLQTKVENLSSGQASPAAPPDTTWWNNYKPSLSPIPSMSVSEALDGSDSRGRPSSRWWEVSDKDSAGNPSMRLERSKRESKYMGVPKELRERLQFDGNTIDENVAGPSQQQTFGPNEYPAEKVGFHEQDLTSPPHSAKSAIPYSPAPFTPNPAHLDVSRLVTLPPPYPRHHPAVNNNHPELSSIRTTVRSLSDFTEVEATKSRFIQDSARIKDDHEAAASKRRNSLRSRISRELDSGNMTYAEAAHIQENAEATEFEKTKEASKASFQLFQEQVVGPLNGLLTDRIERASSLFEQLRSKISDEARQNDPNSTQEEGDEQPELLEKLTLLKWIFEARELLHREIYELLSDRNDRYKEMVITPYKLAKNVAKIENAVKFFAADALQRKLQNEQDILKRTEEFMDVVEKHVRDGVETLLNAFWDIAPDLSRITDKVPISLAGFQIQIPAAEYDENPSYFDFPMQYLYSLLGHCEKSTYQFIESQTNLLCLLHEVKSGVAVANCRLMATQRVANGEIEAEVEDDLKRVEREEEGRLTDDLKEKVRCVEELWSSGLGTELKGCKERVVRFLVEEGGWLDED